KKTRSTRAAASEHVKTPVRVDAPLGSREATLEKLSQDYLHSPDSQTQKALINFCEETKEPSLPGLAYFLIGFSELQHERLESAQEFLRKAAAHSTPIDDYSQYYLAEALFRLGRFEEASEALRNYVSKFSQSPMKEKALSIYWECSLVLNKPQAI